MNKVLTDDSLTDPAGVLDRIRSMAPALIPSERKAALEILNNPESVLGLTTAALAARAEISTATVTRACQNLGFKGYQHLRLLIAREIGLHADARTRSETADSNGLVHVAFEAAARALTESANSVDMEAFEKAAEFIANARRLLVFGNGGSGPVAQSFAVNQILLERPCEAPLDSTLQQLTASGLRPGDVCLAVSESGSNTITVKAARAAHESGATLIGVTAYAKTALTEISDVALITGATYGWVDPRFRGNIVQTVFLSALHAAVMTHSKEPVGMSDHLVETLADMAIEPN